MKYQTPGFKRKAGDKDWDKHCKSERNVRHKKISKQKNSADQIELRARKCLGETQDWREAGYLLSDGTLLDLSGKNQGGWPGQRNLDHREIRGREGCTVVNSKEILPQDAYMIYFIEKANALRIHHSHESAELFVDIYPFNAPTWAQKHALKELVEDQRTDILYDIKNNCGDVLKTGEIKRASPTDIDALFDEAALAELPIW